MTARIDTDALLEDLRAVITRTGNASARTYQREGAYAFRTFVNHWGSWNAAVVAAKGASESIGTAPTQPPPAPNPGTTAPKAGMDAAAQRAAFVGAMDDRDTKPSNDAPVYLPHSRVAFVVGDIHFGAEHVGFWPAFKAMVRHRRPHTLIFNGDIIDAEVLSQYPKRTDTPPHVIDEMRQAIAEINELAAHCVECIVIPGNHDLRWETAVGGAFAMALKGAVGLSLREQFYAQGLDSRVRWVQETNGVPGFRFAETRARHGHNQAKRGGGFGAKHLAAKYLAEEWCSTATNHHHTAQMVCRTVIDIDDRVRTVQAMTIPCATRPHDYWLHPNWQWGCGVIESFAPDYRRSSNYVVVADPETGTFSYGGTTYLGNAKPMARAA